MKINTRYLLLVILVTQVTFAESNKCEITPSFKQEMAKNAKAKNKAVVDTDNEWLRILNSKNGSIKFELKQNTKTTWENNKDGRLLKVTNNSESQMYSFECYCLICSGDCSGSTDCKGHFNEWSCPSTACLGIIGPEHGR